MCTLTKRIEKKKVVVGYKVAIKNDAGEYLSPATIIKYAVGKIPEISYSEKWKRKRNKICDFFVSLFWINFQLFIKKITMVKLAFL